MPSARQLAAAPHRLLFFVGALNVLAAMAWWTWWLLCAATPGATTPATVVPAFWAHAFLMQYHVLPPFIFGFLLTVFPRWMGMSDLARTRYLPVGLGLLCGQILFLVGLSTSLSLIKIAVLATLTGWAYGALVLISLLIRDRLKTWHAASCGAALLFGWLGVALFAGYLFLQNVEWLYASIKIGTFALLLPIYFTVAHRMFPFFAGNVVLGYVPWRPLWLLIPFWIFALVHAGLEFAHLYAWLWPIDTVWLGLCSFWLWRIWPRKKGPALLRVLFLGTLWLPIALALYAIQSLWFVYSNVLELGRAPAHALYIGFFGSLLVAMVTRVTQGHSGRPLELGWPAKFAFALLQLVVLVRIAAEFAPDLFRWQAIAALGWLVAFLPWVIRSAWIYATPRADLRPG